MIEARKLKKWRSRFFVGVRPSVRAKRLKGLAEKYLKEWERYHEIEGRPKLQDGSISSHLQDRIKGSSNKIAMWYSKLACMASTYDPDDWEYIIQRFEGEIHSVLNYRELVKYYEENLAEYFVDED